MKTIFFVLFCIATQDAAHQRWHSRFATTIRSCLELTLAKPVFTLTRKTVAMNILKRIAVVDMQMILVFVSLAMIAKSFASASLFCLILL